MPEKSMKKSLNKLTPIRDRASAHLVGTIREFITVVLSDFKRLPHLQIMDSV